MGQAWEVSSEATGWLLVTGPSPVGGMGGEGHEGGSKLQGKDPGARNQRTQVLGCYCPGFLLAARLFELPMDNVVK